MARNDHHGSGVLRDTRNRATFLKDLIEKADSQDDPQYRNQLYLLAVACLEAHVELDPEVRQLILDRATSIVPPKNKDKTTIIAKAGDALVPLLVQNPTILARKLDYASIPWRK